jgi:hypothetical protein
LWGEKVKYTENYGLSMPSRDTEDIVDINVISENFSKIDAELKNNQQSAENAMQSIGDIDTALDSIIAMQESLIGGDG